MAYEMKYVNVPLREVIPPNTEYLDPKIGEWRKYYSRDGMKLQTNWVIPPTLLRVSERKAWDE